MQEVLQSYLGMLGRCIINTKPEISHRQGGLTGYQATPAEAREQGREKGVQRELPTKSAHLYPPIEIIPEVQTVVS